MAPQIDMNSRVAIVPPSALAGFDIAAPTSKSAPQPQNRDTALFLQSSPSELTTQLNTGKANSREMFANLTREAGNSADVREAGGPAAAAGAGKSASVQI
jgi:hypothetical protein